MTLLRVDSSLQGVLSCLPDFRPSSRNGMVEDPGLFSFLIAGATGSLVGNGELREKAADIIHAACKWVFTCVCVYLSSHPSIFNLSKAES